MLLDQPHRLLRPALLVRADREAEVAGRDRTLVFGEHDLASRQGHSLDADEDVHERTRVLSGSNSDVESARAHGHRIPLAHVLDGQLLADLGVLRRQVAHQDVLADRRPGAGAGHVRASPLGVDQRVAVTGEDRLAAEHVALDPAARGVIVDGQGAHVRHRLLLAVAHVRLLADEVLLLDLAPRHPRLDDVEVGLELGAVGAVALLQPSGGAVHADARRDDAVRLAGLGDDVPQPRALLHRDVQLPAEVADVGDARGEHLQRPDLDRLPAREREPLVGDVIAGADAPRMSRARGPHRPSVHSALVWSVICAEPSAGRWSLNHLRSDIP